MREKILLVVSSYFFSFILVLILAPIKKKSKINLFCYFKSDIFTQIFQFHIKIRPYFARIIKHICSLLLTDTR